MFTGIIERTGRIKALSRRKDTYRLEISVAPLGLSLDSARDGSRGMVSAVEPKPGDFCEGLKEKFDPIKKGDSLSINGACLTVVDIKGNSLAFDIMEETFRKTTFSRLGPGGAVNIERALEWKSRIEGHFVLGHVDKMSRLVSVRRYPRPYIDITITPDDRMYIVKKGSIAIDGISLTVAEIYKDKIRIYIIPYTLENTNLRYKKTGDPINIEFDVLGKYI